MNNQSAYFHTRNLTRSGVVIVLISVVLLGVQCAPNPDLNGYIKTTDVTVTSSLVQFTGTTSLRDDTCIETSLHEDGEVVPWWPSACVTITDGNWEIQMILNSDDRVLKSEATYTLHAWQRDEPSVSAEPFSFDTQGPVKTGIE